jgi:hypothetical protein
MDIYPLSSLKELIVVCHDGLTKVEQGEIRTEKRTSGAKGWILCAFSRHLLCWPSYSTPSVDPLSCLELVKIL